MSAARAAVAVGLLGLALACSVVDPTPGGRAEDLERARARWEAVGPAHYRTMVTRRCFCAPGSLGPVLVTVGPDGATRVHPETGTPVADAEARWFPTVQEAFGLIEEALEEDAHRVDVRYDPASGAPLDIYIDRRERVVDEEMRYELTPPEPLAGG